MPNLNPSRNTPFKQIYATTASKTLNASNLLNHTYAQNSSLIITPPPDEWASVMKL